MLKKSVYIILTVVFVVSTMGITLSMHYCKGRLISTSINQVPKACCDKGGCCHSKSLHLKIGENYLSPTIIPGISAIAIDVLFPKAAFLHHCFQKEISGTTLNAAESPPLLKSGTILPMLQSYLI